MTELYKNYINGEWVEGNSVTVNINPSDTNDIIGNYTRATKAQTEEAITSAKNAFASWSRTTPQERYDILKKASDEILARKDELGRLLSREEGKTLPEGIGEATRAGQIFAFFAGEALRLNGEMVPSIRPGVGIEITREAVGVIGMITPWNFPIAIPAWKIAPALAYGNTIVFKPADLVPGCGWALVDILARAGLPKGVLNLVMGRGSEVGQTILDHKDVNAITFTGSVGTGRKVAEAAIRSMPMKKIQLEMGGKNPLIVLDDADLKIAVESAVNGAFFSTGQRCTASSRLIVSDGIHDAFVAALTDLIGDGDVQTTTVASGEGALQSLADNNYDCVVLDLTLPDDVDESLSSPSTSMCSSRLATVPSFSPSAPAAPVPTAAPLLPAALLPAEEPAPEPGAFPLASCSARKASASPRSSSTG